MLHHGRVAVALHTLRAPAEVDASGPTLLCVHALGGSAQDWRALAPGWPGPVHAIDLAGHGFSGWNRGGFYSPELFAGDIDAGLAELGPSWLLGAGVGAYACLLLAGARPDAVRGVLLWPGEGLEGGGPSPEEETRDRSWVPPMQGERPAHGPALDPLVIIANRDLRPLDYAAAFGEKVRALHAPPLDDPPPWWPAALEAHPEPQVREPELPAALRSFAALAALAKSDHASG